MGRIIFISLGLAMLYCLPAQGQSIPSWKIANLQSYVDHTDSVLVINFWATFCKPCIRELPYIQSIFKKLKGKRAGILLVSLDLPEAYPDVVDSFAKANNYDAP